jgi:hypothetical protein
MLHLHHPRVRERVDRDDDERQIERVEGVLAKQAGRLEQKEVIGRGSSAASALGQSERKLADAWHKATVASPLHDLCATGGKPLCFATNLAVDAPDW